MNKRDVRSRTRDAIVERLTRRTMAGGSFSGVCLPALTEHYLGKLVSLFELVDRPLAENELRNFSELFRAKLVEGFEASPYARFVFSYRPLDSNPTALTCNIEIVAPTLEEQYDEWVKSLGGSDPFGKHPDAKVMELGRAVRESGRSRVLDVGAGTGRNALPLARLGLEVDALEPVLRLSGELRKTAQAEGTKIQVLDRDLLLETTELETGRYALVVLSEVATHFSELEFDVALAKLVPSLERRGTLLFNAFVTKEGYRPDVLAKQAAQSVWSTFFTPEELATLAERFALELASDDDALEYERAHLPEDAWPPTPWFTNWARGHNLFSIGHGPTPVALRWLSYRRT